MDPKQTAKATGIELAKRLFIPTYALRKNLQLFRNAQAEHNKNIVYIKDLYANAKGVPRIEATDDQAEVAEIRFDEMVRRRPASAPSIEQLQQRFLRQKRLAVGTGAAFLLMALYALAHRNPLGLLTIIGGMPLFFMAALSAQFRLWQLRNRRLSKSEKGGLDDFMREPGWIISVLNPEMKNHPVGEHK